MRSAFYSDSVFKYCYSCKYGLLPNATEGFKKYISRLGIYGVLTDQSPKQYSLLTFKLSLSVLMLIIILRLWEMPYTYRWKKLLMNFSPSIITVRGEYQAVFSHGSSKSMWYLISAYLPHPLKKKIALKMNIWDRKPYSSSPVFMQRILTFNYCYRSYSMWVSYFICNYIFMWLPSVKWLFPSWVMYMHIYSHV